MQARKEGKPHGRPPSAALHIARIKQLFSKGTSKREIARQLGISRSSVRRLLAIGGTFQKGDFADVADALRLST